MPSGTLVTDAVFFLLPGLVTAVLVALLAHISTRSGKLLSDTDLAVRAFRERLLATEVYPFLESFHARWGAALASLAQPVPFEVPPNAEAVAEASVARREVLHEIRTELEELLVPLLRVAEVKLICSRAQASWSAARLVTTVAVLSHLAWILVYCLVPVVAVRYVYLGFVALTLLVLGFFWPAAEKHTSHIEKVIAND